MLGSILLGRLPALRPTRLLTALLTVPAIGAVGPAATPLSAQDALETVRAYQATHGPAILRDFATLLAIPNVANDLPGIEANAEYIQAQMEAVGITTELWRIPGVPPAIYGALDSPGATRTLGIYVHYDGQPADPSNWTHGPWEPTLYSRAMPAGGQPIAMPQDGAPVDPEWRLYARSAGDDKAPLGALIPVLRALNEAGITPTANLRFFFEGEEEDGSNNLEAYLSSHRAQLDEIDAWLFFDGPVHQSGRPQLTFGVRGVTGMALTTYGPRRSLHSGHYGNWAPVPGQLMADLLSSMKNGDTGEVLVEGFYDTVEPLGDLERAALAQLPDYDRELQHELALGSTEGSPASLAERLLLPSLTVRGLSSGNVGALARNVIPSTADAVLGMRLVKGNDPEHMMDLVEAHIRSQGYHIVYSEPSDDVLRAHPKVIRVARSTGYPAARTEMDHPAVQPIIAAARLATDQELVLVPALGGSLPLYLFTDMLGKPALIVPVANHDNNQHAPDENLRVANLWYAMDLYATLLTAR